MADGRLRLLFKSNLPKVDWCPLETGPTGRGVPDVNGCIGGIEFWIEFKKAEHWRVTIRPEQIGWAERRMLHGGRVFCAVRCHAKGGDALWLYSGMALRRLKTLRIDEVNDLGNWPGGPAKWDWNLVATLLTKGVPP
jgi:hypothetical protein